MQTMIEIRTLQAADYAQWLPLWHRYLALAPQACSDAATEVTWRRLVAVPPVIHGMGAFSDAQLLGFVHFHEQWQTWRVGGVIYLEDLMVAPEARRQGIARRLVAQVFAFARQQACERVFWKTHADNHAARALYRQLAQETDFVEYEKAWEW